MGWPTSYPALGVQQSCEYAAPSDRCQCKGMERGLEGSQSLLLRLQTLKGKDLAEQVRTIEVLARQNLDLFDEVKPLLGSEPDAVVASTRGIADRQAVVRAALLAVVASDITNIPDGHTRARHVERLRRLCRRLGVRYEQVVTLAGQASALETALAGRCCAGNWMS